MLIQTSKMKTIQQNAKQYFEEEMSGEPLTQEAVEEALVDFVQRTLVRIVLSDHIKNTKKITKMEIKLDRDDILKELTNSCGNDVPFLCQIIDRCTNNWEPYRDVVKGLLSNLITNEEMSDIEEYIIKLKRNK